MTRLCSGLSRTAVSAFVLVCCLGTIRAQGSRLQRAQALPATATSDVIMTRVERLNATVLELEYRCPPPKVIATDQKLNSQTCNRVVLGNAPVIGKEGEPMLPSIPSYVAIPAGHTIDRIVVKMGEPVIVPGKHTVSFNSGYYPLIKNHTKKPVEARRKIYDSDEPFPGKSHDLVSIQKKRGATIAVLNLHPVVYQPKSGRLKYYPSMKVSVITKPMPGGLSSEIPRRPIKTPLINVENPEDLNVKPSSSGAPARTLGICDPAASYQYVAVTSRAIASATTDYTINDLIAHKNARGISATIVTIEDILSAYTGVDDAEKLRNFIIDAYSNWETDYVLLGGDVNVIPPRSLYCEAWPGGEWDNIPSDLYFQCLDGNYNSNGNNRWGEPNDGPGGSDVDLMAEVYVGRASAENAAEMANFVYKTIAYETDQEAAPYLRRALMCGEYLGFGGPADFATESMEEIRLGSNAHGYTTTGFAHCPAFTVDTLYDGPRFDWPASDILGRINSNRFSILNHLGHANSDYIMKFYLSDADRLTNSNFLFAYSQSCLPGDYTVDCMAEHLTTSTRSGMFAVVFNSRYGWGQFNSTDGPSQRFDRQFWDAYFGEYAFNLGVINADSHEDNIWGINDECIRWCLYETNLLGDPQTMIRGQVLGPSVTYSAHSFSDSHGGNGDGVINPGETVDVNLWFTNVGNESANSVTAFAQSSDPRITIEQPSITVGDVNCCGARVQAVNALRIGVSPSCPTPLAVPIQLAINDANGHAWTSSFILNVYTSSQISGTVLTQTGRSPVAGARVNFSGPMSGSVLTRVDGTYLFGGIDGTYQVAVSHPHYLTSDTVAVTVPPSNSGIDFLLSRPNLNVDPASLRAATTVGDSVRTALTIANSGDAPLTFRLDSRAANGSKAITPKYDSSHFIKIGKKEKDQRVGNPVRLGSGGPDRFGYSWADSDEPNGPQYAWTDISSSGTHLSDVSNCDDCYQDVPLSFEFPFYGVKFTSMFVSSNGILTFGQGSWDYSNYPLPTPYAPSNLIALIHSDLGPFIRGDVYFQDFGDYCIVQYTDVVALRGTGTLTFQAVLSRDGTIEVRYKEIIGDLLAYTIGIQNARGDDGLTVAYNTAYLRNALAVRFRTALPWLRTSVTGGTIQAGQSMTVPVTMDASGLYGGTHAGRIEIVHNDPLQATPFAVPCTLYADGERRLSAEPRTLDYGTTWLGLKDTLTLRLVNAGDEATVVSRIDSDNSLFTVNAPLPLTVAPFSERAIRVVFEPVHLGAQTGSLTIQSDAEDNSTIVVDMVALATEPPEADLRPRFHFFSLKPNDVPADRTSVLSNVGADVMKYRILEIRETTQSVSTHGALGLPPVKLDKIYDPANYRNAFAPGRVIVGFKPGAVECSDRELFKSIDVKHVRRLAMAVNPTTKKLAFEHRVLKLLYLGESTNEATLRAIQRLRDDPNVAYAYPDYALKAIAMPNDPDLGLLYGMHNAGQTGGVVDADIDAPEAWDRHTGNRRIRIGIIDTGIDYLHPDLASNMWVNPGEVPGNGIDDDGNGYVDDIHGYDFVSYDGDPMDDHFHGTHCAGTVAAVGNNGIGVAGVMWEANLVALKFLDAGGSGWTSDAINAVTYATAMEIPLTSNSWGGGGYDQGLYDVIATSGGVFVAAAGNAGSDIDQFPSYPAGYDCPNIVSVAATEHNDALADFSNWGVVSVDLAAPGVDVYSCAPQNGYQYLSGTSMATPHVAGIAGLVWSRSPRLSADDVKKALLASVDPIASLSGKMVSGGRVNAAAALRAAGPDWVTVTPETEGQLNPGQSQDVTITVDPRGMLAGTHTAEVVVGTDDPRNPELAIAVTADIAGCRSLSVQPSLMDFGSVWTGSRKALKVALKNQCNETVMVSSVSSSIARFICGAQVPLAVAPFGQAELTVEFLPTAVGDLRGTLTILSNAEDAPTLTVALQGKGVLPPEIKVTPRALSDRLSLDQTARKQLIIRNSGGDTLTFSLSKKQTGYFEDDDRKAARKAVALLTGTGRVPLPTEKPRVTSVARMASSTSSGRQVLIVQDYVPFGIEVNIPLLESMGATVSVCQSYALDTIDLSPFSMILIPSDQGYFYYETVKASMPKIEAFLNQGGILQAHTCNWDGNLVLPRNVGTVFDPDDSADVVRPDHPIVAGAGSRLGGMPSAIHSLTGLPEDAEVIAANTYGSPVLAVYPVGAGAVVATSFVWEFGYLYGWTSADPLLPNALAYGLLRGGCNWISFETVEGKVAPGQRLRVDLSFNATRLLEGHYCGEVLVTHNAPANASPVIVACTLSVDDVKRLEAVPQSVNFGNSWVGHGSTATVVLRNTGNSPTTVSSIRSSTTRFAHGATLPLTVPPFGQVELPVSFAPNSTGAASANLTISSNSWQSPKITVRLSGTGVRPPRIAVTPASISERLVKGSSAKIPLVITNSGGDALVYQIAGRSDSVGVPTSAHTLYDSLIFVPLAKGASDSRKGKTVARAAGGPDGFGYTWTDSDDPAGPEFNWTDISQTGTHLDTVSTCDDCYEEVALSFGVPFYGYTYYSLFVGSNGYLTLGTGSGQFYNTPLPSPESPSNLLAGFMTDLLPAAGKGGIYFQDFGEYAIVQFERIPHYSSIGEYSYQIRVDRTGDVHCFYKEMVGSVDWATVGIQNQWGSDGLTVAFNTPYVRDSLAVRFKAPLHWLSVQPREGIVAPGSSAVVTVTLDAGEADAGSYDDTLPIVHNSPDTPGPISVPVHLEVVESGAGQRRFGSR